MLVQKDGGGSMFFVDPVMLNCVGVLILLWQTFPILLNIIRTWVDMRQHLTVPVDVFIY